MALPDADEALSDLSAIPLGTVLASLTFYCTATVNGIVTDFAITGAQLALLLGATGGSSAGAGSGGGSSSDAGLGGGSDFSVGGNASQTTIL